MTSLMLPPLGILLPGSVLQSDFFAILATFVAINTVMYAALAIAKILPRVYLSDVMPGQKRRLETRSIYPATDSDTVTARQQGEKPILEREQRLHRASRHSIDRG
ncbi:MULTISPECIES: hypothetical protein [Cryobacterium]|uniref:hypothetical protein n=1 Tax=Cryobacterium TaxID=69578 RepID=UPI0008D0CAE7|nr:MULTISPECIES: hypothetical protein [Cryobacterium]SEM73879.1 hypothetical protein SAMN05216281_101323 [Cryobacterium luteum]